MSLGERRRVQRNSCLSPPLPLAGAGACSALSQLGRTAVPPACCSRPRRQEGHLRCRGGLITTERSCTRLQMPPRAAALPSRPSRLLPILPPRRPCRRVHFSGALQGRAPRLQGRRGGEGEVRPPLAGCLQGRCSRGAAWCAVWCVHRPSLPAAIGPGPLHRCAGCGARTLARPAARPSLPLPPLRPPARALGRPQGPPARSTSSACTPPRGRLRGSNAVPTTRLRR